MCMLARAYNSIHVHLRGGEIEGEPGIIIQEFVCPYLLYYVGIFLFLYLR